MGVLSRCLVWLKQEMLCFNTLGDSDIISLLHIALCLWHFQVFVDGSQSVCALVNHE